MKIRTKREEKSNQKQNNRKSYYLLYGDFYTCLKSTTLKFMFAKFFTKHKNVYTVVAIAVLLDVMMMKERKIQQIHTQRMFLSRQKKVVCQNGEKNKSTIQEINKMKK